MFHHSNRRADQFNYFIRESSSNSCWVENSYLLIYVCLATLQPADPGMYSIMFQMVITSAPVTVSPRSWVEVSLRWSFESIWVPHSEGCPRVRDHCALASSAPELYLLWWGWSWPHTARVLTHHDSPVSMWKSLGNWKRLQEKTWGYFRSEDFVSYFIMKIDICKIWLCSQPKKHS